MSPTVPTTDDCPRCETARVSDDFETDPRFGRVCDRCHAELIREHGEPSRGDRGAA